MQAYGLEQGGHHELDPDAHPSFRIIYQPEKINSIRGFGSGKNRFAHGPLSQLAASQETFRLVHGFAHRSQAHGGRGLQIRPGP